VEVQSTHSGLGSRTTFIAGEREHTFRVQAVRLASALAPALVTELNKAGASDCL
jgi:hypothetical protein